jgi:hypothetical protein
MRLMISFSPEDEAKVNRADGVGGETFLSVVHTQIRHKQVMRASNEDSLSNPGAGSTGQGPKTRELLPKIAAATQRPFVGGLPGVAPAVAPLLLLRQRGDRVEEEIHIMRRELA